MKPKPATRKRVAVGMSGGVDSSVAALLLKREGYDVMGLTAVLWKAEDSFANEDAERAAAIAEHMGIPHHIVDLRDCFRQQVVDAFQRDYLSGRTPSPCVVCNEFIKFGALLDEAERRGCDLLATGHYARVVTDAEGQVHLYCGEDVKKDQSYFLHRLDQGQLARTCFPLASLKKDYIRTLAQEAGLPMGERRESQDLCFVPDGDYAAFVEANSAEEDRVSGEVIDEQGRVLAPHTGVHKFTIGQRKGLGAAAGKRVFVRDIDAVTGRISVAPREQGLSNRCALDRVHWISGQPPSSQDELKVRLRYRHQPVPACIEMQANGRAVVKFDTPQFAVTPGQAAVFYRKDEVLGGGWITKEDGA